MTPDAGGACSPSLCAGVDAGGFCAQTPSCIADRCVNECSGGRSCEVVDAGRCLSCTGAALACAPGACTVAHRCSFTVSGSACVGLLDEGSFWNVDRGADCRETISNDAGVILGSWFSLGSGDSVATLPRLGGACTVHDLFTNVPRVGVYCPYCSFVAEGCE